MKTLVRCLHGSRLYGTATPTSDHDFRSVHVPSGTDILLQSAAPVVSTSTGSSATRNVARDMDDESVALHRYFRMLRDGDTNAIETLFAPASALAVVTPEWEAIAANRARFVNRRCEGFVGYCRTQARKYSAKGDRVACVRAALAVLAEAERVHGPKAKLREASALIEAHVAAHPGLSSVVEMTSVNARPVLHWEVCDRKAGYTITIMDATAIVTRTFQEYGHRARMAETNEGVDFKAVHHALRVALEAKELLATGNLTLPRPPEEAAYLIAIKTGRVPYAEVAPRLDSLLAEVEAAASASVLPEESDVALMDEVVVDLYGRADRGRPRSERVDPLGREADPEAAFGRDPRLMLAVAARCGQDAKAPSPEVLLAMSRNAHRLRDLPASALRSALFEILATRRPSYAFRALNATGALDAFLPELSAADGVVQNSYHAFDVLGHVMAALDASSDMGHDVGTRLAVLLHDVGKPATALPRPDGKGNRFHGHEVVGAAIADSVLKRLGVAPELSAMTVVAVREHMYPIRDASGRPNDEASIRRLVARVGRGNVERLLDVRKADIRGKGFDFEAIEALDDAYAHRVRAALLVPRVLGVLDLPVDGSDVVRAMVERGLHPPTFRGGRDVRLVLEGLVPALERGGPGADRDAMLVALDKAVRRLVAVARMAEREAPASNPSVEEREPVSRGP